MWGGMGRIFVDRLAQSKIFIFIKIKKNKFSYNK